MDLVSFLPESSSLQQGSFERFNDDEGVKRLVLRVSHSVAAKFGGRTVEGSSDVCYILQSLTECGAVGSSLNVTEEVPYVAVQSPDLVRAITESLRPRMSYALAETVDGMFDLRALAYNLGACFAAGSSGAKVPFHKESAGVRLLTPSWSVPVKGEVTLGPGVARTGREFVTLAAIAGPSGISVLQLVADTLPNTRVKPFQGYRLASFTLRAFAHLLTAAQGCGSAPHHLQAFYRGMTATWSLWSHTDEGGWLRNMLKSPSYPPSSGVLAAAGDEIIGLPLKSEVDAKELTRIAVGMYLSFSATMVVADCHRTGLPSVINRDGGDENRPSCFGELAPQTYEVLETWRNLISDKLGLHRSAVLDGHSCRSYFNADRVDDHLHGDDLLPFWWVEPSFLYTGDPGKLEMPVRLGKVVEMPLLRTTDVIVPAVSTDFRGCLPAGATLLAIRSGGGIRMEGASYLLSGTYRPADGLTHAWYVTSGAHGANSTEALFVEPGVVNCAARRWLTPHNPVANPAEGYIRDTSAIRYEYRGRNVEPAARDWLECKVYSSPGFFRVGKDDFGSEKRCHKSIPTGYSHIVRPYDLASPQISLKQQSLANEKPAPEEAPDPVEAPVEDAGPGQPLRMEGPPTETVADDSPPIEVGLDPNVGMRQELLPARHEGVADQPNGSPEEAS